jgi:SP family general alpha glucoside:H+ symporter-like MFS transporter
MTRLGRATLYMCGLAFMFLCLIAIGGLGFAKSTEASLAIGILLVISTLCNMITVGPVCYPIVAETPSGRLRYKTIVIGRIVYNLTGIFSNSVTPRMISATAWNWGAKAAFFYAGTNLLCLIWCWFRLPETKDRSFGEIDILFENKISARKFKYTKADRESGGPSISPSADFRQSSGWTRSRWRLSGMRKQRSTTPSSLDRPVTRAWAEIRIFRSVGLSVELGV